MLLSLASYSQFAKANITQLEYFLDADPGVGEGNPNVTLRAIIIKQHLSISNYLNRDKFLNPW